MITGILIGIGLCISHFAVACWGCYIGMKDEAARRQGKASDE